MWKCENEKMGECEKVISVRDDEVSDTTGDDQGSEAGKQKCSYKI